MYRADLYLFWSVSNNDTQIALLAAEELADQVWEVWDKGLVQRTISPVESSASRQSGASFY